jgi:hypothetical protein
MIFKFIKISFLIKTFRTQLFVYFIVLSYEDNYLYQSVTVKRLLLSKIICEIDKKAEYYYPLLLINIVTR